MKEIVFLLEEESAKALLESLLPRIMDQRVGYKLIAFEGKQDLERQVVRRLKGYINPEARFLVMRDKDSSPDCQAVKQRLVDLCHQAGKVAVSLVRIACHELETIYLADLTAVESALSTKGVASLQGRSTFRNPDALANPSQMLRQITKGRYQKVSGSREIGAHLEIENTRSATFKNLISGIRRLEAELLAA